MQSPEVTGKGIELDYQMSGFSQGILDTTRNSTSDPLLMSTVVEQNFRGGFGIVDKVDFYIEVPFQSSSRAGMKIQVFGEPRIARAAGNKLAIAFATGSSQDTLKTSYDIKLKSELKDYAIIHGYRFSDLAMLYESVSLTNYSFKGTVSDQGLLDSDTFDYRAHNILGFHIGLILGSPTLQLKTELGVQKITWSHTESKNFYSLGYAFQAGW